MRKFFILFFVATFLLSCASREKIVYLQNGSNDSGELNFETYLKPDDILLIVVLSEDPAVAEPYNLKSLSLQGSSEEASQVSRTQTYLVDREGFIDFPFVGKIKLAGLTKEKAVLEIQKALENHVKDAIINLRILNFKVSVLGEVNNPGAFNISGERITILEAIGKAGDLTIYGRRDNVLLIREEKGTKKIYRIDLTKLDFNSPYYYLTQNDVIYVEPNKTKVNSSAIGPNITVGISALSLIVTIIALATR